MTTITPAGIVLADDGRVVVCLDDGLHAIDVDDETDLLASNPAGLNGRANDAAADDAGDGGVWSCLLGAGLIVRYTQDGEGERIVTWVEHPSDVTFGGDNLTACSSCRSPSRSPARRSRRPSRVR